MAKIVVDVKGIIVNVIIVILWSRVSLMYTAWGTGGKP
jgi:hypothetical protein